ncbi:MAG TPA: spondin domain-containing protein, partial [Armatimonadota bacterium]
QPASLGLQKIAEEGDRSQALTDLAPMVGGSILDLESPLTSPLPPLGSFSVTVGADAAHPLLSAMWMLGRTNDGFAGLDSIDLAAAAGTSIDVVGLDAGTENNNEKAAYMAALGGHLRDPENGVIHLHPGILGIADAPIAWNWTNPVARIQVARASAVPEPGALSLLVVGLLPLIRYRRRQAA